MTAILAATRVPHPPAGPDGWWPAGEQTVPARTAGHSSRPAPLLVGAAGSWRRRAGRTGIALIGLAGAGAGLLVPTASVALAAGVLVVLLILGGWGLLSLARELRRSVVRG